MADERDLHGEGGAEGADQHDEHVLASGPQQPRVAPPQPEAERDDAEHGRGQANGDRGAAQRRGHWEVPDTRSGCLAR